LKLLARPAFLQVPFIEFGYSLQAASHAEAHGSWQFIESAAENYEIGIDPTLAGRVVLLTRASSECMVLQSCVGDESRVVPPATVNGLPRR